MEPVQPLETAEHQEERARRGLNSRAALVTAALMGCYFLIFSRGWPWLGTNFFDAAMGRVTDLPVAANLLIHAALALGYSFALGFAVYRFRPFPAAFVGMGAAVLLYGCNFALAQGFGLGKQGEETGVLLAHLFFGLFGSLIYKASSVPPPLAVRTTSRVT
jgi:hypothetical protein